RIAKDAKVAFRELAASEPLIRKLQKRLERQGVDLRATRLPRPDYTKHYAYEGLQAAAGLALASGNYTNDFKLDEPCTPLRMGNHLRRLSAKYKTAFRGRPLEAEKSDMLSLEQAAAMMASVAEIHAPDPKQATAKLLEAGLLRRETLERIPNPDALTNGDAFLLIRDLVAAVSS